MGYERKRRVKNDVKDFGVKQACTGLGMETRSLHLYMLNWSCLLQPCGDVECAVGYMRGDFKDKSWLEM